MAETSSSEGDCEAELGSPIKNSLSKGRFEQIYREGKRVSGEFCRLMALPGNGLLGFATPRALGCIARRNKMKRRFRAAVLEIGQLAPFDWVVAISAKSEGASYPSIQSDVQNAMQRMRKRWAEESASS